MANQYTNLSKLIDTDQNSFISNIRNALTEDIKTEYDDADITYQYSFDSGVNVGIVNALVLIKKPKQMLDGNTFLDGLQKLTG
jgi:hypothetical protein